CCSGVNFGFATSFTSLLTSPGKVFLCRGKGTKLGRADGSEATEKFGLEGGAMVARVLEAYVGEYASGKSENAINRGCQLARSGRRVRLVDLDLVEPFYTLRPLKRRLEREGLEVLAWETSELVGLGEAAIPL